MPLFKWILAQSTPFQARLSDKMPQGKAWKRWERMGKRLRRRSPPSIRWSEKKLGLGDTAWQLKPFLKALCLIFCLRRLRKPNISCRHTISKLHARPTLPRLLVQLVDDGLAPLVLEVVAVVVDQRRTQEHVVREQPSHSQWIVFIQRMKGLTLSFCFDIYLHWLSSFWLPLALYSTLKLVLSAYHIYKHRHHHPLKLHSPHVTIFQECFITLYELNFPVFLLYYNQTQHDVGLLFISVVMITKVTQILAINAIAIRMAYSHKKDKNQYLLRLFKTESAIIAVILLIAIAISALFVLVLIYLTDISSDTSADKQNIIKYNNFYYSAICLVSQFITLAAIYYTINRDIRYSLSYHLVSIFFYYFLMLVLLLWAIIPFQDDTEITTLDCSFFLGVYLVNITAFLLYEVFFIWLPIKKANKFDLQLAVHSLDNFKTFIQVTITYSQLKKRQKTFMIFKEYLNYYYDSWMNQTQQQNIRHEMHLNIFLVMLNFYCQIERQLNQNINAEKRNREIILECIRSRRVYQVLSNRFPQAFLNMSYQSICENQIDFKVLKLYYELVQLYLNEIFDHYRRTKSYQVIHEKMIEINRIERSAQTLNMRVFNSYNMVE